MYKFCTHLKQKKYKPYCKLLNKEIALSECYNCISKEYKKRLKEDKVYDGVLSNTLIRKIKKRSNK